VLLADLALGVLAGFTASMTRPELRQWFRNSWYVPACYTIGVLLILPFTVGAFLGLGGRRDQVKFVIAGSLLGSGAVGAGVMGARTIAPDK
jgi:hypothetical protein